MLCQIIFWGSGYGTWRLNQGFGTSSEGSIDTLWRRPRREHSLSQELQHFFRSGCGVSSLMFGVNHVQRNRNKFRLAFLREQSSNGGIDRLAFSTLGFGAEGLWCGRFRIACVTVVKVYSLVLRVQGLVFMIHGLRLQDWCLRFRV